MSDHDNRMPLAELEMARTILKNLSSEKYKDRNTLFLKPFDLAEVPGYLELVGEPLDLQTVPVIFFHLQRAIIPKL